MDLPGPTESLIPVWCLYTLLTYVFLADLMAVKVMVARLRYIFPPLYQYAFISVWKKSIHLLFGFISRPVFSDPSHEFLLL